MSASPSHRLAALRRDPVLPPGFSATMLRESGDAFAYAVANAAELGAASIVWVRRFDLLEFAVVLEPEEPLMTARLAHYMAMNALADMLAVYSPPERPMSFAWPDAILLDHGLIGGGRTAWPANASPEAAPDWLVFGAMIRASSLPDDGERSFGVGSGIAMDELGFDETHAVDMVESFCRHLMLCTHEWTTRGPKAVVKRWLDRLVREPGLRHGIEPNGDLLVKGQAVDERRDFVAALAEAAWYDRERGEPKL